MDFYLEPEKAKERVLSAPYKLSFGKQLSQDISLPDFYEDLARVIDCSARAAVTQSTLSGGVLSVTGEASYCVLYYSDKDSVLHRFCFEQEFEAKWDTDTGAELLELTLFCREPSVKIYGSRKLSVTMDCDFTAYMSESVLLESADTENAELLKGEEESFTFERLDSERSRFSEDFVLPAEYPSAEEIVYWDMTSGSVRCDQRSDGFIVNSDARLSLIYTTEDGEYVKFITNLPLTRFIRSSGGDAVRSRMLIFSPKCAAVSDSNGENRRIALDFELSASSLVYRKKSFSYVADAYSTECASQPKKKELSSGRMQGLVESKLNIREHIENDGDIKELLSVRIAPELSKTRCDGEMLYGEGVLKCTLLAKTEGGGMSAYEHEVTFDVSLKLPQDAKATQISLETDNVSFGDSEGGFELSAELFVSVFAFGEKKCAHVYGIELGEREEESGLSMLIYYPDRDESLWDIGKKHRVSTERISAANGLDTEALTNKKFILIPKK